MQQLPQALCGDSGGPVLPLFAHRDLPQPQGGGGGGSNTGPAADGPVGVPADLDDGQRLRVRGAPPDRRSNPILARLFCPSHVALGAGEQRNLNGLPRQYVPKHTYKVSELSN